MQVDGRLGLAHPDLAGDDDNVERALPLLAGVVQAPRVGEQRGLEPSPAGGANRGHHRCLVAEAGEHPRKEPLRRDRATVVGVQPLCQLALEVGDGDLTALQCVQARDRRAFG